MGTVELKEAAVELGLRESEYDLIAERLGREPTIPELGMYSVMWSEHCGYKHSRPFLKLFPRYKAAIEGEGLENAGVIDIGDGLGVVMKMESHNHPSAVEPYQGAATGVGGILRDIFTMGARPIASLNSLWFGDLSSARVRFLFEGVVAGIAGYGNCVGVPTVAGEVHFDPSYSENPVVNCMSVGLVELDRVALARADGAGNPVMIVGNKTGRDGIAGASFASVDLGPDSESRRPNVQMGDPFTEKLLIEATLEALATGHIVGIQDMGAAGITCSTTETAAKGRCGMHIDLDKVPVREGGMTAFEMLLSESQERMLCIVRKGKESEVASVFDKWGLEAEVIGDVIDGPNVVFEHKGQRVADAPAAHLADESPVYTVSEAEPGYIKELKRITTSDIPEPDDHGAALVELLGRPTVASKRWVFQQYDHQVQTNTAQVPGGDAAVLRIKGTQKAIALSCDCNSTVAYIDPFEGGKWAVAEAARNLACVGARPLGVTDCLNFGNPEKPEIGWQFARAVAGVAEACEALSAPVVSGNVSFYNESPSGAVHPTPVIGMLGGIQDISRSCGIGFRNPSDLIALLGDSGSRALTFGATEYAKMRGAGVVGPVPEVDLSGEKAVCEAVRMGVFSRVIRSAHDISEGGLGVSLAESCIAGGLGARVWLERKVKRPDLALFGENPGRVVVTVGSERLPELERIARRLAVPFSVIGTVSGTSLEVRVGERLLFDIGIEDLRTAYEQAIPRIMDS
jgi:phosphoribosylformylglycinamidine synthase II